MILLTGSLFDGNICETPITRGEAIKLVFFEIYHEDFVDIDRLLKGAEETRETRIINMLEGPVDLNGTDYPDNFPDKLFSSKFVNKH